ncbi:hypothetical protein DK26_23305 [Bosea sp. WAO]|nr:hypothetical protein DK26_23305 [Bosea sp. WAO]
MISTEAAAQDAEFSKLIEKRCVVAALQHIPTIPGGAVSAYKAQNFDKARMARVLALSQERPQNLEMLAIAFGSDVGSEIRGGETLDAYRERLAPLFIKGLTQSLEVSVTITSGSLSATFRSLCAAPASGAVTSFKDGITG